MNKAWLLAPFLAFGCTKQNHSSNWQFAKSFKQDIPYVITADGEIIPSLSVDIKPQVAGTITYVGFKEGDFVQKDTLLFKIDSLVYEAKVKQAEAQLAIDQAKLKLALDYVQTYQSLVTEGYVSRLDYQEALQNVDVYRWSVEQDLSNLSLAKINLAYTEIRAPFSGFISEKKMHEGNFVDPQQDEVLATLVQVKPLHVKFSISQEDALRLRSYELEAIRLEVNVPYLKEAFEGSLYSIAALINQKKALVRGTIHNCEEKGIAGTAVQVRVQAGILKDALLLPKQAAFYDQCDSFVFVLNEQTGELQKKKFGRGIEYKEYIVAEWGIEPGEHIAFKKEEIK